MSRSSIKVLTDLVDTIGYFLVLQIKIYFYTLPPKYVISYIFIMRVNEIKDKK